MGIKRVASSAYETAQNVGSKVYNGAVNTGSKVKDGVSWTGEKVSSTTRWVTTKASDASAAVGNAKNNIYEVCVLSSPTTKATAKFIDNIDQLNSNNENYMRNGIILRNIGAQAAIVGFAGHRSVLPCR